MPTIVTLPSPGIIKAPTEPTDLLVRFPEQTQSFLEQAQHAPSFLMRRVPRNIRHERAFPNDGESSFYYVAYERAENLIREWEKLVAAINQAGGKVGVLVPQQSTGPANVAVQDTAVILYDVHAAPHSSRGPATILLANFSQQKSDRADEPHHIKELYKQIGSTVIDPPAEAELECGDLVVFGNKILVRQPDAESRINRAGLQYLRDGAEPLGYSIIPIEMHGSLHLTHACTWAGFSKTGAPRFVIDTRLLTDVSQFSSHGFETIDVASCASKHSANVLLVGDFLIIQDEDLRLQELLIRAGFDQKKLMPVLWETMASNDIGFTCCTVTV